MLPDFPHEDPGIPHPPGSCLFCDRRHDWQMLRYLWGLPYSALEEKDLANAPVPPRG